MSKIVTLQDCPVGLFLAKGGSLCFKSEYTSETGRIDAYVVSTGEAFWGGVLTATEQRLLPVTPVSNMLALLFAASAHGSVPGPVANFLAGVAAEVARAISLFPGPNPNLAALTEEVGELAKAVLDARAEQQRNGAIDPAYWQDINDEAMQVAAMACRIACEGDPTMDVVPEGDS